MNFVLTQPTPGNLDKLIARFREDTLKLFEKHGMTNAGYWVPMDEKYGAVDKLVYLLSYPSRDAAKASWKTFSADAQWQEVRNKTEAGGKIVAKVDSVDLTPSDYAKAMDARRGGEHSRFRGRVAEFVGTTGLFLTT
jgi:hypothetical protein